MSRTANEELFAEMGFYDNVGLPRRVGQEEYICTCGVVLNGAWGEGDLRRHEALYHNYCEKCLRTGHRYCDDCGYIACNCHCPPAPATFIDRDAEHEHYQLLAEELQARREARAARLVRRHIHRRAPGYQRSRLVHRALMARMYR